MARSIAKLHGAKLCSVVRVLAALIESGDWEPLTKVAKLSGLYYTTAREAVEYLVKAGLVEERIVGRMRLFRAVANPSVKELIKRLEKL